MSSIYNTITVKYPFEYPIYTYHHLSTNNKFNVHVSMYSTVTSFKGRNNDFC